MLFFSKITGLFKAIFQHALFQQLLPEVKDHFKGRYLDRQSLSGLAMKEILGDQFYKTFVAAYQNLWYRYQQAVHIGQGDRFDRVLETIVKICIAEVSKSSAATDLAQFTSIDQNNIDDLRLRIMEFLDILEPFPVDLLNKTEQKEVDRAFEALMMAFETNRLNDLKRKVAHWVNLYEKPLAHYLQKSVPALVNDINQFIRHVVDGITRPVPEEKLRAREERRRESDRWHKEPKKPNDTRGKM